MGLIVRSLVLACSVTLVLPPGWCCLFQCRQSAEDAAPIESCCGGVHLPVPSSDDPQPPTPVPAHDCPCVERIAAFAAEKIDVHMPPAAPLHRFAWTDCSSNWRQALEIPAAESPRQPLHLLHCVWLC